ncbi:MAG: endopeptidase La [Spirochaeta sp.]|nr:endopeptidase La [Spirochaeta sp.]
MKLFSAKTELAMIPLRDMVVFPQMVVPFFVGRKSSIKAVEEAMAQGRIVFLSIQKTTAEKEPAETDLFRVGTVARILQMLKLPDGTIRLLVEGGERANIIRYINKKEYYRVQVKPIKEESGVNSEISALVRILRKEFSRYSSLYRKIPAEIIAGIEKTKTPDKLVNIICANVPLVVEKKVELLTIANIQNRLETLASILAAETEVLELENKINTRVRKKLEKTQKEYFLHEQLKEIQKELGTDKEDPTGAKELEEKLKAKKLPEEIHAKCEKELKRLSRMQTISPESALLRTYLEWIADLPWTERTSENKDIDGAQKILDEDHYDLKEVKERVLDFIAVRLLKEKTKGPILCFVGPPGTGKTSLGRSVARALGREFIRISLGGVRDEAEIRGHRKTYVGALPGKIIQAMKKAGHHNPVFLLDEVDKMSSDFRGDPASALLEVLDPEQNSSFADHYLEVPYDLSDIMFITTANSVHNIPFALRDRMEIIHIPGYTEFEKVKIAQDFLIPKQINENGLQWADIKFNRSSLVKIIRSYTMEAGVRNLEREIANILRKLARQAVKKGILAETILADSETVPAGKHDSFKVTVTESGVRKHLGNERFQEKGFSKDRIAGLAAGLAWTELGGVLLPVEVAIIEGKGDLILTGNMGDVMKESAQTALSFLRANAASFNIKPDFNRRKDIHIHIPEGAIPKDGPSAGITIIAALLSALSNEPVIKDLAMTGEITLTGRLLPIGGVKEKVLAAHRYQMTRVLMPEKNRKDIDELPKEVLSSLQFFFSDFIIDALLILFPALKLKK